MLKLGVSRNSLSGQYFLLGQRRHFLVASAITLGGFVFGRKARLADAMDSGELHNKNNDDKVTKTERMDARLKSLSHSRPMKPRYEGHVPLYLHEKLLLFVISGLRSYYHPEDGTNIIQLGESSAFPFVLESLKQTMLRDDTGRRILREQPNITSETLNMDRLSKMGKDTLGRTYYNWLIKEGVSPDTRAPVTYIDDPMHAFIFKRYRQCHDFYHALNGLPIIIEGEIAIKALEAANMGIPMAALGAILAPLRLKPVQRERLYDIYLPWAVKSGLSCKPLINVYWEELLEKNVQDLRSELGIYPPPDLRAIRKERLRVRKELKMKYEAYEAGK
ncbi:COQ4 (YDR204W) [Zygosaccharomyces parabailii]|nr:COQ4 (YDR204W) [Zygosaccharomyces parabailii]CDH17815.1 probable Ubiquinone biosynthesis protein COQ4,mitochondrial [Zygosaccharomyces bailii ISA1307]